MSNCQHSTPCGCETDCTCPIKLDFSCVIYNKANNDLGNLPNLNLSNGATLKLFAETVDAKFTNTNFLNYTLPILRQSYVVNTQKQFSEAVDTQLGILNRWLGNVSSDPSTIRDGDYWYETSSGELRISLDGSIRVITIT